MAVVKSVRTNAKNVVLLMELNTNVTNVKKGMVLIRMANVNSAQEQMLSSVNSKKEKRWSQSVKNTGI